MTTPQLIEDLEQDEGFRSTAYQDTVGVWTVGFGHAHVHPGTVWSREKAKVVLLADVEHVKRLLDIQLPWWRQLSDTRQDVIANMAFNMGVTHLLQFHRTLAAIQQEDWDAARYGMLTSKWAEQVKGRANRLALQLVTGRHA